MPRKSQAAPSNLLRFPEAHERPPVSIVMPKGYDAKNVSCVTMASNIFAHYGIVRGDIVIMDKVRQPEEGELFVYMDPTDDSGRTIAHYSPKKHKGREICGTVIGFQRLFGDSED